MTICTSLRKIVVSNLILVENALMVSGLDCWCTKYPTPIPKTIAMRIYKVSLPEEPFMIKKIFALRFVK
jgi:hypothetical protein